MKIGEAKLCVNCEEVFSYNDSRDGSCPVCGSVVTIFVNRAWANMNSEPVNAGKEVFTRAAH